MKYLYKVLIGIIFILTLIGCKNKINKMAIHQDIKTYKWDVEGGAPKNYPGVFYYANLIYDGGSKYVPAGAAGYQNGWGWGGRSHTQGNKPTPLPHRLQAVWVSTVEKQAYLGDFELDTEKIEKIFEKGNIRMRNGKISHNFSFKVSIAPGGIIAVWIEGIREQIEIGYFKGQKTDKITYKDLAPQGIDQSLEQYCERFIKRIPVDIQQQLIKTGPPFGLWDKYRKKYKWNTAPLEEKKLTSLDYHYFNGEKAFLKFKEYDFNTLKEYALPYEGIIDWETTEGKRYEGTIHFNEESIFKVFEEVYQKKEDTAAIFYDVNTSNDKTSIKAFLQNESIKKEIQIDSINVGKYPD
ncbi:DUF2931 family protein [Aquimarina sp. I32.4]|uniref:DUF2931 family protein n=1 Tax=Aquimarina sp. I32.4 TaxID=2053903 RepID=UPI000CDE651A|nr:DUF2931 family protein [Aquimarina sp. I32.4]